MKTIMVINHEGLPSPFKADAFSVDQNGYLALRADGAIVAMFSPPAWHGVYDTEAGA
jgi:hypothetical protein